MEKKDYYMLGPDFDVIDASFAAGEGTAFCRWLAIHYIRRAGLKTPESCVDLVKGLQVLQRWIEKESAEALLSQAPSQPPPLPTISRDMTEISARKHLLGYSTLDGSKVPMNQLSDLPREGSRALIGKLREQAEFRNNTLA